MPTPPLDDFGGWPGILRELTAGRDLTADQAAAAMADILDGGATSAQIAGFIVSLRMKRETVEELSGLLRSMLAASGTVPLADITGVVDVVGTGGDGHDSINVSTLASLVVAGAGGRVCKHGNRSASSACGAADLLEELGVVIDLDGAGVAACIEASGMGFCFAPTFHASMRHAGPTRRELGVPTVFNSLGPMANPARVRCQVVGVSDPAMSERMAQVLAANGSERVLIVHGHDGLDELSTTGPSTVHELRDGVITAYEVDPAELGLPRATLADLRGGGPPVNAGHARSVLAGDAGPHRDIVVLNAAAGLVAAGLADDLATGIELAAGAIDSGAAAKVLDDLAAASRSAAAAQR
jgi:anthranilate phosphoribosyltransferase